MHIYTLFFIFFSIMVYHRILNMVSFPVLYSRTWLFIQSESGKLLSHVRLFATPWTVTHQAPPSMGFSRQEHWNGLPFPSPGDLPNPGIEPRSPALQAEALTSEPPEYNQRLGKYHWGITGVLLSLQAGPFLISQDCVLLNGFFSYICF